MLTLEEFVDSVEDIAVFEFQGINLFKIFYNQIGKANHKHPLISSEISSPSLLQVLSAFITLFKALLTIPYLRLRNHFNPYILFFGAFGRSIQIDDVTYDLYNYKIVQSLGRERVIVLESKNDGVKKEYLSDIYFTDFRVLTRACMLCLGIIWKQSLKKYARTILQHYPECAFHEDDIALMVKIFFAQYYIACLLLKALAVERVILICYYDKEFFIVACKHLNIPTTELMHGTIIPTHAQYSLHNVPNPDKFKGNMLLPDRLGVYGPYWQRVVQQGHIFPLDSVFVVGYYLKVPDIVRISPSDHKTAILVTTQPTVQSDGKKYLSFLKDTLEPDKWKIIIKPHPAEDANSYASFEQPNFISISELSVYHLLNECNIHISVYSTVLYEAVRYGVCNYTLLAPDFSQHCRQIVESGVAIPLSIDQIPALYTLDKTDSSFYFASFAINTLTQR